MVINKASRFKAGGASECDTSNSKKRRGIALIVVRGDCLHCNITVEILQALLGALRFIAADIVFNKGNLALEITQFYSVTVNYSDSTYPCRSQIQTNRCAEAAATNNERMCVF